MSRREARSTGPRALGLSGVRRDKGIRTSMSAKDGIHAGDLLNVTSPHRGQITPG
ncbi:hypothetical protein QE412_001218 [Microbacterium trichothecenolyticum]|uniref:Uncharacterized protein n=1 Tax=Microbacterium trichothecenolyticum TaxID=69370 RepID=A0ABU0TSK5_MICTR|nr:hypothetical protein [Microbacterium trichothecenolyticum]